MDVIDGLPKWSGHQDRSTLLREDRRITPGSPKLHALCK